MAQLVGKVCTFCQERLSSELDAGFCAYCGCPSHWACRQRALAAPVDSACLGCGASPAVLAVRVQE